MKVKPVIIFRILLAAYFLAVMYLCFGHFEPSNDIPRNLFNIPADKVAHFMMFLPFVPLTFLSFYTGTGKKSGLALFCAIMFVTGCVIAGGIEIAQGMTTYRSKDIFDFVADALGLATGTMLTGLYAVKKRNR